MKENNFTKGLTRKAVAKGFTLIELLVVVAIIGILATVVLAALGSARSKGADAAVQTNLNTVRGQAELYSSNNNNAFLPVGGSVFAIATCPVYSASGTNMLSRDRNIASSIAEAVKRGGNGSSCYNSSLAWSVAVGLNTDSNASWCVDSAGKSKLEAFAPASAIDTSTFLCK